DRRILSSSSLQVVIEPQIWESESMATVTYATYFPNEDKLIVVKQSNTTPVGLSKSYFQTSDTQIFTCD
ncbi:MAG: hypothetical protein J0L97_09665, partial [Alphaproteobacteria bacterium]|nr:hypothetical protein [Alphaproteobacteria bacterium]